MEPVKENLATMLDDVDGTMVTLSAGDTKLVVHRAVLAARSPVFGAMVQNATPDACFTISNVEGPVLRQLMVYMYTLEAPQLPDMLPQMLAVADKYCLSGLKDVCKKGSVKKVPETTAADLGALLDAGDGAVVTLEAGQTRLAAHRAVLAARSPVFEAMFRHDTLEASSGQVSIPDVEGPVLRQLLAYCYSLQAPRQTGTGSQLLVAADKYGLSALKAACEQQVVALLAVQNAAAAAVLALRHSCPGLKQAAVSFIKTHTHQVMMTQGWADAVLGHPHTALELTRLITVPEARPEPQPPEDIWSLSQEEKSRRLLPAAEKGSVDEVRKLCSGGGGASGRAHMRVTDGEKRTALHLAAGKGHVAVVRYLLHYGANPEAMDRWQRTPLHYAAEGGHAAVVRLLLANYATVNATSDSGRTPLHCAASNGHTEVVAALMAARANMSPMDELQKQPLDDGKLWNNQKLTELLQGRMQSY